MNRRSFAPTFTCKSKLHTLLTGLICGGLLTGCMAPPHAVPAAPAASGAYTEEAAEAYEAPAGDSYAAPAAAAPAAAQSYRPSDPPPGGMSYEDYGTQGFIRTAADKLSTFAVDVDTGSYTVARGYLGEAYLPEPDSVRLEEFVNYFDYRYPAPHRDETFAIHLVAAPSPYSERAASRLLQVGIQGYAIPAHERPDVVLTFVVDVSGSMDMENRIHLAKRGLKLLVEELRPTDEVAIVAYGTNAHLVLPMTTAGDKELILNAIDSLWIEGSTNAEAGLRLAYKHAAQYFNPDAVNRVVLVSDGVANVGDTSPAGILAEIERYAGKGIALTTVGMGMGNYNDTLMEQLADKGDGFYAYVDTMAEARRLFVEQLTGTLLTIAKDAKVQVEFNPETVERYRLLGYENRDVADDDFRNDDVDAGEIGAGHSVTALYELEPVAGLEDPATPLATVRLRWEEPQTGEVLETARTLTLGDVDRSFTAAHPRFQLAIAVAEFAEILKNTPFAEGSTLEELAGEIDRIEEAIEQEEGATDHDVTELRDLVWTAAELQP
jgi:Ca-activated chloride channel family protein